MNIYVVPETYRAMYLVVGECLKVEKMSLFTKSYGIKHITLAEFESVQAQNTNNVMIEMNFKTCKINNFFLAY